ncbi:MAG TPA: hypothetical protein VMW72_01855 [Sedimentisphaerales bacterium]|nr:hypothetical protein [Sedimentisphaerales bacterium]
MDIDDEKSQLRGQASPGPAQEGAGASDEKFVPTCKICGEKHWPHHMLTPCFNKHKAKAKARAEKRGKAETKRKAKAEAKAKAYNDAMAEAAERLRAEAENRAKAKVAARPEREARFKAEEKTKAYMEAAVAAKTYTLDGPKYVCVLTARWCGWLSFVDQSIVEEYITQKRKLFINIARNLAHSLYAIMFVIPASRARKRRLDAIMKTDFPEVENYVTRKAKRGLTNFAKNIAESLSGILHGIPAARARKEQAEASLKETEARMKAVEAYERFVEFLEKAGFSEKERMAIIAREILLKDEGGNMIESLQILTDLKKRGFDFQITWEIDESPNDKDSSQDSC